ncbi:sensor histidine kinase [Bacillus sp. FJAT-27445]|uniref:sensor histidine kinase n=1 Tax=Bacillus sp. FJAT-27445 TaxID=1679166 RepID=UPI0007431D34|nr:ATP-binding protein [Bacillus sp. FJAT-27445]
MWRNIVIYILMAIIVPIAGELKFFPFQGDLRVSLGTPAFFFILLWFRKSNPILAGFLTGTSVVIFRIVLNKIVYGNFLLEEAIKLHFPVFFYYVAFAVLFHLFKIKKLYKNPVYLGLFGVAAEIISTLIELFCRSFFSQMPMTAKSFMIIVGIAFFRSFFVLGFYNIFVIREARLSEGIQRKRNEEMLLMVSNLYVERIQLKKSMKNAEELTGEWYALYRELKGASRDEAAKKALGIAGRMHEVKKDSQRIYAGLSKLMAKENLKDVMSIEEILDVAVTANKRYGEMQGKQIQYGVETAGSHPDYHAVILLSLLNNLISNAVEAISSAGKIGVCVWRDIDQLRVVVKDTGSGIPDRIKSLVFEPGFTTKFSESGIASNGIGLSFVKDSIESLGGGILLLEGSGGTDSYKTIFHFSLPVKALTEREEFS